MPLISRDEAFAQGCRLAWRYCPIAVVVAVCCLLFSASMIPIITICLIAFIIYVVWCGFEGRILR